MANYDYDVVIDIGHGADTWENGGGKGVRKNGEVYEEHNANARQAKKLIKILEAHGLKVLLTQQPHENDIGLAERVRIATSVRARVFISIHHNAGVSEAKGVCVFAWMENSPKSQRLQELIVNEWDKAGIDTHGSGQHESNLGDWDNFYLLREMRYNPMAIVLTENGFMTNDEDFENIFGDNKEEFSDLNAIALGKALLNYLGVKYYPEATEELPDPIGTFEITTEALSYRVAPDIDAPLYHNPSVLYEGHTGHVYEIEGKWHRLGWGWASAGSDGSLLKFTPFPEEPKEQPKEPEQELYRVIIDGVQVGAYAVDSNVLQQAQKAIKEGQKNIVIEKV